MFEVIVVDNASDDDTRKTVEEYGRRHPQIRYCLEERLGLSHARNRGWQEARGDYVGYLDDDAKAPPGWLDAALQAIDQRAPAALGGPIFTFHDGPIPLWFKNWYDIRDFGAQARPLDVGEYLSGANLFFRRTILEALEGFDPNLGMAGKRLAYGEETAVQLSIRAEMPEEIIYYEPRLYIHHLLPAWKKTWRGILRTAWARGRYSSRVSADPHTRQSKARAAVRAVGQSAVIVAQSIRGLLWRDRGIHPHYQNFAYEVLRPQVMILAALCERAGPQRSEE